MQKEAFFVGIDVGTQGVRVVLMADTGQLIFDDGRVFKLSDASRQAQSPEEWWEYCCELLKKMAAEVNGKIDLSSIKAIGVTSTSGTVIPLDAENRPLHPAIMYSDKRSEAQGKLATKAAATYYGNQASAFNSSSGLAKMLWFAETYPEKAKSIGKWIHAADYITGKLSGQWGITDYTNSFKSGFDVNTLQWPTYISDILGVPKQSLPKVVPSGDVLGNIDENLAAALGLSSNTLVCVGITDGCASQIASGAILPGNWNTTIGTTLVIKGVVKQQIKDPQGSIYSHKHPINGWWMPGGASNTGADWVSTNFAGKNIEQLTFHAESLIPSGKIVYPLMQEGERFPMLAPQAKGFGGEGLSDEEKFVASMEGVAFVERYAYELLEQLSGEKVLQVYTAGGASNSDTWLKIRSAVLRKKLIKMKYVSGGVGAAILAASKTHFADIVEAVQGITIVEKEIQPDPKLAEAYEQQYKAFINEMVKREIITEREIYA